MDNFAMGKNRAWTVAIFFFIFGDAVAMQARGPLLSSVGSYFDLSEAALGLVAPAGTIGFLCAVVAIGLSAGQLPIRRVLILGTAGTAAALGLAAAAPTYWILLVALIFQGTAAGAFRGLDRVVLSHLYPNTRGRMYAAYTLIWAIGAVLAPQLVTLILSRFTWRLVFLVLVCCFIPTAVLAVRYQLPSMDAERSVSQTNLVALCKQPPVMGACLGMVLIGALEGTLFTWLVYYAQQFHNTTVANTLLSVYLLAYIPGRIGCTLAADRVPYLLLLFIVFLPAAPALMVAFSGVTGLALFASVFVAGFSVSSGFPTLSAYAVEAAPSYSGPLNAVTNGSTYLGLAVAPAAVGILAEIFGLRRTLLSTVGIACLLIVTILMLWLWTGTAAAPTRQPTTES